MSDSPGNRLFHCEGCGWAGEPPTDDDEPSCPDCGEDLPLTRSEPTGEIFAVLEPARGIAVRRDRPPLKPEGLRWAKFWILLFRPFVSFWTLYNQRKMILLVEGKLARIADCRHRAELEQIIGPPLYAVDPKELDGATEHPMPGDPDLIECYESHGCCIDLWFRTGRLIDTSGFVKPTRWDVAMTRRYDPSA